MEIAHNTQEKFDFYVLALVFTLLAFSVQSADFQSGPLSTILELSGWVFLLISGVSGLSRIEYIPVERVKLAQLDDLKRQIHAAKRLQLSGTKQIHVLSTGEQQPLGKRVNNLQRGVDLLALLLAKLENKNALKYRVHKIGFLLGLALVVIARGIEPFFGVLNCT
jgi:hypothetical protein